MNEQNDLQMTEKEELPAESAENSASTTSAASTTSEKSESTAEPVASDDSAEAFTPIPPEPSKDDEKRALEEEIAALRAELRQKKEEKELLSLFPELEGATLPDEVTAMAETGVPLAASYALFYCQTQRKQQLAAEERAKNHGRSSGSLGSGDGGAGEGGFTLAEISMMSPKEVRKHYREILRSLERGK